MKGFRIFLIGVWCTIAVVGAWLLIVGNILQLRTNSTDASDLSLPVIGKPFELVSQNGQLINNATLKGKPYLAFFGFTHCPDICPTTLFELTDLMSELGPMADRFKVAFISVDPERDTEEMLKEYMKAFDTRIMALRGNLHQTEVALKAFAAYAKRVPTEEGNYTMDHTAAVYLMDADGAFTGTLDMHESRDVRLHKIRNLLGESS